MESKLLSAQSATTLFEYDQTFEMVFSSNVLPIFDHISQLYLPFEFLEIIQIILCILQFFEASFWVPDGKFWIQTKFAKILHYISFYSSIDPSREENVILFFIFFLIVLIISILFITSIIHYKKIRRVNKPIICIIRTYYIFIGGLILHPMASLCGNLFIDSIIHHEAIDIVMLIFTAIGFFLAEILFYFNIRFLHESIYIHKSLFMTFDSNLIVFLFIWDPFYVIFQHLFKFYPNWSFYILILSHILLILIFMRNHLWFSMILKFSNHLYGSFLFSMIFNSIFRIFVEEYPTIGQELYVIICVLAFIILLISFFFTTKYIKQRIIKKLNYSFFGEEKIPTLEEKTEHFTQLGLDIHYFKAMTYLVVGFTSVCDMFIDFSLIQFCSDNYKSNSTMISLLIHLLSYFKSEKNRFDTLLNQYNLLREKTYFGRFMYYQAHQIKLQRQVTATSISMALLNDLKMKSISFENQVKSFWDLETADMEIISKMEGQQKSLSYLWEESIENNWNSLSFREEHIRFLIESATDFQMAVKMTNIKDKIEILSRERDDFCFLTLLLCFPKYYKSKIVDLNGDFIKNKKIKKNQSTHSSILTTDNNNDKSSLSTDNDLTNEDQIANSIISSGKIRLSMQNALKYIRPGIDRFLFIYSIILVVVLLVAITAIFIVYENSFDKFDDWNKEVGVLISLRLGYVRSFFSLLILFGKKTKRFAPHNINCSFKNAENLNFMEFDSDFVQLALSYVDDARNEFSNLLSAILDLSLRKVDISILVSLLFDPIIQVNCCYQGEIVKQVNWSMEQILNFQILSFAILANDDNIEDWYHNSTYWCHDLTNFQDIENTFAQIQNALAYDLSNSSAKSAKKIRVLTYIVGSINFAFFIPVPIFYHFYYKEINKLAKLILSTDQEYKNQAKKNISLGLTPETNEVVSISKRKAFYWKFYGCCISLFSFFICFILFECMILYYSEIMTENMYNYGFWSYDFSSLRAFMTEIMVELLNAVYYVEYNKSYLTIPQIKTQIYTILRSFERYVYDIMNDTPEGPSAMGKDSVLDSIVLSPICDNPDILTELHDIYKCASLNRNLAAIHSLILKIVEDIEKYEGKFQGDELSNIYHLVIAHTITQLINIGERFTVLQKQEVKRYNEVITIFYICGVIFLAASSFFLYHNSNRFKCIFNMAISLIRRLPPAGLISNNELTNYLLYKKGEEIEMGVTHKIFNSSFDGIICLNCDGIIEIINKSFSNDYGYSTEQLVGQLIGTIFDNESREKLENQLKLMKNHESNNYTDHIICFTNDGRAVPSFITLFGINENENSLILVVRDETILLQKKKRLELAKKQSQDLLEQIMPPKVLMMLKEGKSEISFAVPSATVMFVNIVNFSGFSADLSPQQIMGTLSTLFGAFDVWIQKFPLMTKIKLIGDNYMAACGLFATDIDPENHAIQSVDFALCVLNILDDTNLKLNMDLQIRIGINSGGPIIAGVLGTENRVFDIIGDTINVASRLEHKSEPGHILMSQQTYDYVKGYNYHIIPKGEVFLKGKGNMQAYSI